MNGINYLAIIVVAILAFIASMVWYVFFGKELWKLNPKAYGNMKKPKPRVMLIEIIRNLILAFVLSYLILHLGVVSIIGSISLGILLWLGFPLILLSGSVIHEKVPVKLAAIHVGDWLIKILLMVIVLGLWH